MKKTIFSIVLTITIFISKDFQGQNYKLGGDPTSKIDTFVVCGNCYTCKLRIHDVLDKLSGLNSFDWSWEEFLAIDYNPSEITPAEFLEPIANVGHDNEMFQAPRTAYETLIGTCCEYDRWLTYETLMGIWNVKCVDTCKNSLLETVTDIHGITQASWSNESLSSTYYKQITDPDNILFLLANAGYDNEKYTATNEAYNSLSEGCKYERDATSIGKKQLESITVYPNPTVGNIIWLSKSFNSCKIIDALGKTVLEIKGDYSKTIDVSKLKIGYYHLLINSENTTYTSTLIKQ